MASRASVLQQSHQSSDFSRSLFGCPTRGSYRAAVAAIIRDLKATHGFSNERLAERLRCSESTIFNAENENGNLEVVILLTIAYEFTEATIDPVRQLYLCAPTEEPDALTLIERGVALLRRERS
jgi:transcriptional regulator with XRE-family HTH domain